MFYYTSAIANYFIESSAVGIFVDLFLASLVVPLGLLVFGRFWSLKFLDSDMIYPVPKEGYIKFPLWYDVVLHTNVAILPFIDMMLSKHEYLNRLNSIILLLAMLMCYLIYLLIINQITGKWVYGILEKCDSVRRFILFGVVGALAIVFYFFGEMCNDVATKIKS